MRTEHREDRTDSGLQWDRHELWNRGEYQPSDLISGLLGFRGMRNNCSVKKRLDTVAESC